jgi:DNA polymerase-1
MSLKRPRLFLVDTFGLIFRAYYGRARSSAPTMRTSAGLPTEAVYIFHNIIRKLITDYKPEYLAAVWEGEGPTFRDELFPAYKATRTETPAELIQHKAVVARKTRTPRISPRRCVLPVAHQV